jgi:hypothetical protein
MRFAWEYTNSKYLLNVIDASFILPGNILLKYLVNVSDSSMPALDCHWQYTSEILSECHG